MLLELFDVFVLPVLTYGLPLWITSCSESSLQAINAVFTKFIKRYLQIPTHSNNAIVHFLTSTIPLSERLKMMAPNYIGSLSFPTTLHGCQISFLSNPPPIAVWNCLDNIPTTFWLSKTFLSLPICQKSRRRLCRELLDCNHHNLCKNSTFHPSPSPNCICIHCNQNAHAYHDRYCEVINCP